MIGDLAKLQWKSILTWTESTGLLFLVEGKQRREKPRDYPVFLSKSLLTMQQGWGSQAEHAVLFEETEIVVQERLRNLKAVRWSSGKVRAVQKKIALGISSGSPSVFADLTQAWSQTPGSWGKVTRNPRAGRCSSSYQPEWRAHVAHWECSVEMVEGPHLCTRVKIVIKTTADPP